MRAASIDIGTNSIILTLVESDSRGVIETLATLIEEPRLGAGLAQNGAISSEAIGSTAKILKDFSTKARQFSAEQIIAFGTEVFRRAENGREAADRLGAEAEIEIKILTPEEEARYAFFGAMGEFLDFRPRLVFDIGGASTELIWGGSEPEGFVSLPIGALILSERFPMPLDSAAIFALSEKIDRELDKIPAETFEVESAVGVGGTMTTLSAMFLGLESYIPEKVHKSTLPADWLSTTAAEILVMTANELRTRLSFAPHRADILPFGTLLARKILERGCFNEVIVSDKGGRFGVIYEFVKKFYT